MELNPFNQLAFGPPSGRKQARAINYDSRFL